VVNILTNKDIIEAYLSEELRVVNKSLPLRRKSLAELMREEYPHVITRDGGIHMFRRSELKLAHELLGDELADRLYLPIILEVRTDLKETTLVVKDEVAVKLIAKVLGLNRYELPLYLYPVHLQELRKKIETLIQYAFTLEGTVPE